MKDDLQTEDTQKQNEASRSAFKSNALLCPYYQDDYVTIYHGEAECILPHIRPVDLLLTDPPYGIGADKHQGKRENGWIQYDTQGWDNAPAPLWLIEMARTKASKQIIWGGNYFILPPTMGWLIWDKGQRDFSLADCEMAWTSEKKAARIFTYSRAKALQDGKQHPTQKPIELMKWCIKQMGEGGIILDPFMGSGTTLIAAKELGRKAIGIEREQKYCDIAIERLKQEVLF